MFLQEQIQKTPGKTISYELIGEEGPDHDKVFKYEVHINSNLVGTGMGRSKKEAEQNAAREALDMLKRGDIDVL